MFLNAINIFDDGRLFIFVSHSTGAKTWRAKYPLNSSTGLSIFHVSSRKNKDGEHITSSPNTAPVIVLQSLKQLDILKN